MKNSRRLKEFREVYAPLSNDIYAFAKAVGFTPTAQQKQLFNAVMRGLNGTGSRFIAVKSGQGPGKTTTSAVIGAFLQIRDPFTKLIVTAPTMRQCQGVWLAECRKLIRGAHPAVQRLFDFTGTGMGICGYKKEDWGTQLITATRSENAQGQHREDMHLIVEEASGVSREIIEQFKGTLTNPGALFIQIGNPNSRESQFFDCFNSMAHKWATMTWNAEETPASRWFDPARNRELEEEFGRDSDVYRIRVLGEFPHSDPNCVMSSEDVLKVMDKRNKLRCLGLTRDRQFGIDFARFGGDESVIIRRSGLAVVEHWWRPRVDPNDVVDKAFRMEIESQWSRGRIKPQYVADAGGMGQGVMRSFHDANKKIHEFHNHGKSAKNDYANKITQAWFDLARKVSSGRCYLPKDNILMQQLSTRQYFTDKKGRLVLESKDDYLKRGHNSPDRADGTVLAFWDGASVSARAATANGSGWER